MHLRRIQFLVPAVLLMLVVAPALANQWFVSPAGSETAAGTQADPWGLNFALSIGSGAVAGDTIWVLPGDYYTDGNYVGWNYDPNLDPNAPGYGTGDPNFGAKTSTFSVEKAGTAAAPIIVQNWQNGRATIHGNIDLGTSSAGAFPPAYVYFKGLEIKGISLTYNQGDNAGFEMGNGSFGNYSNFGLGVKVLNCVVHDVPGGGIYTWSSALGCEINGNLSYYNGIDDPNTKDSNTGGMQALNYGLSSQTTSGDANIAAYQFIFKNNIVHNNDAGGVRLYGSTRDYATYDGDTMFNNGSIATSGMSMNFVATDYNAMGTISENDVFTNLNTYMDGTVGGLVWIDWTDFATVTNNYCVCEDPNRPFTLGDYNNTFNTCTGNTIFGTVYDAYNDLTGQAITANVPTTGSHIVVQSCPADIGGGVKLEPGRANVIIYNWAQANSITASLPSTGLNGVPFSVYDAQNFYGAAVVTGTYGSGSTTSVVIPMTGTTMAARLDANIAAPAHTTKKFGAVRRGAQQQGPDRKRGC